MASEPAHGISLALVLRHVGVDKLNNVCPDGGEQNFWDSELLLSSLDGHERTSDGGLQSY
jgi:hypothetical protein